MAIIAVLICVKAGSSTDALEDPEDLESARSSLLPINENPDTMNSENDTTQEAPLELQDIPPIDKILEQNVRTELRSIVHTILANRLTMDLSQRHLKKLWIQLEKGTDREDWAELDWSPIAVNAFEKMQELEPLSLTRTGELDNKNKKKLVHLLAHYTRENEKSEPSTGFHLPFYRTGPAGTIVKEFYPGNWYLPQLGSENPYYCAGPFVVPKNLKSVKEKVPFETQLGKLHFYKILLGQLIREIVVTIRVPEITFLTWLIELKMATCPYLALLMNIRNDKHFHLYFNTENWPRKPPFPQSCETNEKLAALLDKSIYEQINFLKTWTINLILILNDADRTSRINPQHRLNHNKISAQFSRRLYYTLYRMPHCKIFQFIRPEGHLSIMINELMKLQSSKPEEYLEALKATYETLLATKKYLRDDIREKIDKATTAQVLAEQFREYDLESLEKMLDQRYDY